MLLALEAVAVVELRDLILRQPLLVEVALAALLDIKYRDLGSIEHGNALEQRLAPGQAVKDRARVVRLAFHPRLHLWILQVFEIAIVVRHLGTEVIVRNGDDRSHRRGRWRG